MQHFSLNLETLSPLAIRADHAPGGVENAEYISGTTLLGSLAALHRLMYPGPSPTFERLFLSGQVQYPDLYPASFRQDDLQGEADLPIYPLPKTAQSCKRYPGFRPEEGKVVDDEDRGHGARDMLLDWALFTLGDVAQKNGQAIDTNALLRTLRTWKECPDCEKPMDHFTGYYRRSEIDGRMAQAKVETRLQTRTGINRATGTVQESILYSRQVFQEHARFWGALHVDDDLAPDLQQFLEEVGSTGLVRIGTGRSRGMGKVSLSIQKADKVQQERLDSFKQRVEDFNTMLRKHVENTFGPMELAPFYFALTLHSSVILRDELLRYRGVIDGKTLRSLLPIPDDTLPTDPFTLVYQNADTRQMMGWNELWGMPRTKEVAIETGSVFLFSSSVGLNKVLLKALFELEEAGVGRRKAEGFGRICISDQFHQEVSLK